MLDIIRERRQIAGQNGEPILRDESFELLLKLVKEKKSKRILEVGVNLGYSGIAMLLTNERV